MTDQLIVDGGFELDLIDSLPVPISFSISDVKEPQKRKQSFSKEVTLPSTSNNRAFFVGNFGFTSTLNGLSFDATSKVNVTLKKNGIEVLNGLLKLDKVTINNGVISFICRVLSDSVDIFQLLSTINVAELGWSEHNHTLTRTNVKASWITPIGTGYCYPLIERGNGRIGATIWRTTDISPYVFMHEVMLKIFKYLGITWSSAFLDSTLFKSILFGYGGGEFKSVSATEINKRKVLITSGNTTKNILRLPYTGGNPLTSYHYFGQVNFNPFDSSVFTSTETQDLLSQYNDGIMVISQTGNYNVSFNCNFNYNITLDFSPLYVQNQIPRLEVYRNGVLIHTAIPTGAFNIGALSGSINMTASIPWQFNSNDVISFKFVAGQLFSQLTVGNNSGNGTYTLTTPAANSTITLTATDSAVTDGSTIELGNYIPTMKCSDFLLGVIRQFNLYLSDKDNDNVVRIEPLTDFYKPTNQFIDITKKVDISKEITLTPSSNEFAKEIEYKYKKNTDADADRYALKWGEAYGDNEIIQGSFYAKGKELIELPWSSIVPFAINNQINVPRFVKIDNGALKINGGAPRIMFYNGLKAGNFTLRNSVGGGSENLSNYPSVHHFDNYLNPLFDLNFKLVSELYYVTNIVTTKNCYSQYYAVFVDEMTSASGQLVKLSVTWDELEIKNRDFSKLLMYNGGLFRLNKIDDFVANVNASTGIEMVKVLKANNPRGKQVNTALGALTISTWIGSPTGKGLGSGVLSGAPVAGIDIGLIKG